MGETAEELMSIQPVLRAVPNAPAVTTSQLRLQEFAEKQLAKKELRKEQLAAGLTPDKEDVMYSARVWAQVTLPYRDPGDTPTWIRRNNGVTLVMTPAQMYRPDGSSYTAYPFGLLPRHALTWLATEAYKTKEPVISLGKSLNAFMGKLGLSRGGKDQARLEDQLQRLVRSTLSIAGFFTNDAGTGDMHQNFFIAENSQFWWSRRKGVDSNDEPLSSAVPLFESQVTLSDRFFKSIIESPIPVNPDALKALGSSPMRYDMYIWATYRMYGIQRETKIKWADLNQQFGGQYATGRQFRAQFIKHLKDVQTVYPDLNAEPQPDYLILRPSNTHVRQTTARRKLQLPSGEDA
jgi:hypothetical protein